MNIRIRDTGAVVTHSEFRAMFPNTGFPPQLTEEIINSFGGDVVFEGPQAQPTRYQVAFRDGVEQIDGKWFTKYSVADMDDEAKARKDEEQAKAVREQRNQKLKDSDWTQVLDAPFDQTTALELQTYRQGLRDITSQPGFPWDVQWPEMPA
jgi:hypothetical protein